MMTPKRRSYVGPLILVVIGVSIMLTGLALHWMGKHGFEWAPQFIGACIAFAGFFAMDSKLALGGGGFLVDSGLKVWDHATDRIAGRRSTDSVVVPPVHLVELPTIGGPPDVFPRENPVRWQNGPDEGLL